MCPFQLNLLLASGTAYCESLHGSNKHRRSCLHEDMGIHIDASGRGRLINYLTGSLSLSLPLLGAIGPLRQVTKGTIVVRLI